MLFMISSVHRDSKRWMCCDWCNGEQSTINKQSPMWRVPRNFPAAIVEQRRRRYYAENAEWSRVLACICSPTRALHRGRYGPHSWGSWEERAVTTERQHVYPLIDLSLKCQSDRSHFIITWRINHIRCDYNLCLILSWIEGLKKSLA